jgi:hypothetical protein
MPPWFTGLSRRARKLLHLETRIDIDPVTWEASKTTTLLVPRFHQWELVNLLATVSEEGRGHRYLAMHSAGSGKTDSIGWTAHGLATLSVQQTRATPAHNALGFQLLRYAVQRAPHGVLAAPKTLLGPERDVLLLHACYRRTPAADVCSGQNGSVSQYYDI